MSAEKIQDRCDFLRKRYKLVHKKLKRRTEKDLRENTGSVERRLVKHLGLRDAHYDQPRCTSVIPNDVLEISEYPVRLFVPPLYEIEETMFVSDVVFGSSVDQLLETAWQVCFPVDVFVGCTAGWMYGLSSRYSEFAVRISYPSRATLLQAHSCRLM